MNQLSLLPGDKPRKIIILGGKEDKKTSWEVVATNATDSLLVDKYLNHTNSTIIKFIDEHNIKRVYIPLYLIQEEQIDYPLPYRGL